MPSTDDHIPLAAVGLAALFNEVISTIFDLPPAMVWTVFTGCFIGLMFRPAVIFPPTKYEKLLLILKTLVLLIFVTVLASWLVPFVLYFAPELAKKGLAGFTGFIVMVKHTEIIDFVDYLIKKFQSRADR